MEGETEVQVELDENPLIIFDVYNFLLLSASLINNVVKDLVESGLLRAFNSVDCERSQVSHWAKSRPDPRPRKSRPIDSKKRSETVSLTVII